MKKFAITQNARTYDFPLHIRKFDLFTFRIRVVPSWESGIIQDGGQDGRHKWLFTKPYT